MTKAYLKFGDQEWAVDWSDDSNKREYMIAQFAFEAKRAAEREFEASQCIAE